MWIIIIPWLTPIRTYVTLQTLFSLSKELLVQISGNLSCVWDAVLPWPWCCSVMFTRDSGDFKGLIKRTLFLCWAVCEMLGCLGCGAAPDGRGVSSGVPCCSPGADQNGPLPSQSGMELSASQRVELHRLWPTYNKNEWGTRIASSLNPQFKEPHLFCLCIAMPGAFKHCTSSYRYAESSIGSGIEDNGSVLMI